jgi:hypothetical protein
MFKVRRVYRGRCGKCMQENIRTFLETDLGPRYLTLCSRCGAWLTVYLDDSSLEV